MLKESAFGKNDIRGIYGDDVTEELFYYTGRGFVQFLVKETKKLPSEIWISVCRDARLHSPSLSKSLIEGIRSCGANRYFYIHHNSNNLFFYAQFYGLGLIE